MASSGVESGGWLQAAREARWCFPKKGAVMVAHDGGEPLVRAREFFLDEVGAAQDVVDRLVDPTGAWAFELPEKAKLLGWPTEKLFPWLVRRTRDIYKLANGSLDTIAPDGYNRHDLHHVVRVAKTAKELLEKVGADQKTINRGVIIGLAHDWGNILSRKLHGWISARMIQREMWFLPAEDRRIIRRGVILHNEREAMQALSKGVDFPVEAMAVIIADKTEVGPARISESVVSPEAVERDWHLVVNALGQTETVGIEVDEAGVEHFVWEMKFDPGIDPDGYCLPLARLKSSDKQTFRVHVPEEMQAAYKEQGISYKDFWLGKFMQIYEQRLHLVGIMAKKMFPQVQDVRLRVVDIEPERFPAVEIAIG